MKTLLSVLVVSMALAGRAGAQNVADNHPANLASIGGLPSYISTQEDPSGINTPKIEAEPPAIQPQSKTYKRGIIPDSMVQATERLVSNQSNGSTELLRSGKALDLSTTMSGGTGLFDKESINVHVAYNARPVGGILNIRVELVPVFGGIGSAVRPTISRDFAQAVDDFDDDFITQTILKLTVDLSSELGTNQ
jgi:hypothetical protein